MTSFLVLTNIAVIIDTIIFIFNNIWVNAIWHFVLRLCVSNLSFWKPLYIEYHIMFIVEYENLVKKIYYLAINKHTIFIPHKLGFSHACLFIKGFRENINSSFLRCVNIHARLYSVNCANFTIRAYTHLQQPL